MVRELVASLQIYSMYAPHIELEETLAGILSSRLPGNDGHPWTSKVKGRIMHHRGKL